MSARIARRLVDAKLASQVQSCLPSDLSLLCHVRNSFRQVRVNKTVPKDSHSRLTRYLDAIALSFPSQKSADAMRDYCTGLLLPAHRKNIELMAARLAPVQVGAKHQSMHHFISKMEWNDDEVLSRVCSVVSSALQRRGLVSSWIIDSVVVPKQGQHSVGSALQCSNEGRHHRCQIAVTLSIANRFASLPVASRLFLPQEWTDNPDRRRKAGVPEDISFQNRPSMVLQQVEQAVAAGLASGVVVGDEEYGQCAILREGLRRLDVPFILAVPPSTLAFDSAHRMTTVNVASLAASFPDKAWGQPSWPGGGKPPSRFAAQLVPMDGPDRHEAPLWLLAERSLYASQPKRFWLSSLPVTTPLRTLVSAAKARSRTLEDRKQRAETGLGHFEGRGWRGFHHHATLSIVAYGFMIAERCSVRLQQRFHGDQLIVPDRPFGFRSRK